MIPIETGWHVAFRWRNWLLGFVFGPEIWNIYFGPFVLFFVEADNEVGS